MTQRAASRYRESYGGKDLLPCTDALAQTVLSYRQARLSGNGTFACGIPSHAVWAHSLRLYSRGRRWIQCALGAFFAFAGVKLLTSRL